MEVNKPKEITLNEAQKRQRMQTIKAPRQRNKAEKCNTLSNRSFSRE